MKSPENLFCIGLVEFVHNGFVNSYVTPSLGKFGQKSFASPKICLILHLRVFCEQPR